jgi:hypothetical protein
MTEIHIQNVFIEADNEEDAHKRVAEGEGIYIGGSDYSETIDEGKWDVDELNKDAEVVEDEELDIFCIHVDCKFYGNDCQPDSDDACLECIDFNKKGMQ